MSIFKRTGRGFTLIELLVVIAIIGILSSVVLASLNDARTKSRDAKRIADIKQVQLALELYFDANGSYPSVLAPLSPTYMSVLPTDPVTHNGYSYAGISASSGTSATTCTSYHLGAALEQLTNQVLGSDNDATAVTTLCTNPSGGTASAADFSGLSTATAGAACNTTAGTAGPSGTEGCYDLKP